MLPVPRTGSRSSANQHATSSRGILRAEIQRLAEQSVAPKTLRSYHQAQSSFATFRNALGYSQDVCANSTQVAEFIAWLSLQNKSPATIAAYVSGISFWHKIQSQPDPTKTFLITKLISGLRRGNPTHDSRLPITGRILQKLIDILPTVTKSEYESIMYKTGFILAFFGFLRLAEFTCENSKNPTQSLKASDVTVLRTGGQRASAVQISLHHSKNNQYGRNQLIALQQVSSPCTLCPVRTVEAYLKVRPQRCIAFLSHYSKSPLTRHEFQAMLRKAIAAAGLEPRKYTSHSFRIGAASAAAGAGWTPEQIQNYGRWSSNAFQS